MSALNGAVMRVLSRSSSAMRTATCCPVRLASRTARFDRRAISSSSEMKSFPSSSSAFATRDFPSTICASIAVSNARACARALRALAPSSFINSSPLLTWSPTSFATSLISAATCEVRSARLAEMTTAGARSSLSTSRSPSGSTVTGIASSALTVNAEVDASNAITMCLSQVPISRRRLFPSEFMP